MAVPQRQLSRNEQIAEIVKCGNDPIYFIRTYAKIQHPLKGTIPFTTYKFQDSCVKAFEMHRLNIILKSRQLGLSTICAAYATWLALFSKDKSVLVIATKLPTAMNFIKKVKFILKSIPSWLLLTKYEPTKQNVVFENGSSITAVPTSEDAGRSEGLSLLIVDEAAWIRDFDQIWTGIKPTISEGGRAIILSTPNGVGGQYYKLWVEAEANVNGFNAIKIPWYMHPEHNKEWFVKETRGLGKREISQEFECSFITSGDTFLQPDDILYLRTQVAEPLERKGHDRNVWIWERPASGKKYVISADVSRGDAHDYSTFHVINVDDYNIAAEYMGKVPPERLADMLLEWGEKYNTALLAPENNTFGYFVCTRLKDANYRRIYYSKHRGDPFNYTPSSFDEIAGFPTNQKSRVQILAKLEELIRTKQIKIRSQRLVDQLNAFIWDNGKPVASRDSYDDLVMSVAIGCWLSFGDSTGTIQDIDMANAILNSTKVESHQVSQLYNAFESSRLKERQSNPFSSVVGGRHVMMKYAWLLK